jgi:catechol 2,3-dioxygenase-like lactoylglutathione lyase family enzyme
VPALRLRRIGPGPNGHPPSDPGRSVIAALCHRPALGGSGHRAVRRSACGPAASVGCWRRVVKSDVVVSILGIDHVQIAAPSGCETEARRFYGELLRLEEVRQAAALARRGGAWFKIGKQQLHVGVEASFRPALKAHPALRVAPDALDGLAERLSNAGVPPRWDDEIPGVRRFYVDDPWGNRLELLA